MPKQEKDRRSLELSPAEWSELERLAAELGTLAVAGPGFKRPSWRILIREIAQGTLLITHKESHS